MPYPTDRREGQGAYMAWHDTTAVGDRFAWPGSKNVHRRGMEVAKRLRNKRSNGVEVNDSQVCPCERRGSLCAGRVCGKNSSDVSQLSLALSKSKTVHVFCHIWCKKRAHADKKQPHNCNPLI